MNGIIKRRATLTVVSLLFVFILFYSCRKNEGQYISALPGTSSSLNVSPLFNFETMQNVDINIQVQSNDTRPLPHVIKIYDANPGTTGQLITTGLTDASLTYNAVLRIPAILDTVWIENDIVITDSTFLKVYQKVAVFAKKINYSFTMMSPLVNRKALGINDPGCSTGCTRTISTKVASIQINDYEQVCLTVPFNGKVTFTSQNSTAKLVICSSDTLSNITVTGNGVANIIVSNNGSLNLRNITNSKVDLTNYGTLNVLGGFTVLSSRTFTNYGIAWVDVLTNSNGTITNNNILNITRKIDNSGTLSNQNILQIAGSLINNASSTFNNECRVNIMGDFQQNGNFNTNGYVVVSGNVLLNAGSKTNLSALSNLEIAYAAPTVKGQITISGDVTGPLKGSGKITVAGITTILSTARLVNQLDICDADGIETLQVILPSSVTQCKSFIPATYCTSESGTSTVKDQDHDGVPDVLDEFPTDPDRAFTSYYPNKGTFATLCINDLWPNADDGAMNDLVIEFQYKIITNSQNQVVDIYGTFHPKAEGAELQNAFAVALPVPPSAVQTIEGTKTYGPLASNIIKFTPQGFEAGHLNNTVFSVINNVYYYYSSQYSINVWPKANFTPMPEAITIHVKFATPIAASQLIPPYNPFLIPNLKRSYEIHLIDHPPTELVDLKVLGTVNDRSNIAAGTYYRTTNNIPWMIEIPISFDYMDAMSDIVKGYLKYTEWAESGGTKSKDWYIDKPGYRNNNFIYPKK